ncbi:MAG: O-antigen ligase family protein [Anaerolineae bacterium]
MGVFCDKIIEAGWLAAVIVTPLLFDWYSNRVFEASKVALLRSITVVMLAAWLIKILEVGSWKLEVGSWKLVLRTPLVIPTLILAGVHILATITSISPHTSFWGSYERWQGTYTTLSYMAIFLLTLQTLRRREQLERLITTMILVSLPVALYGIIQHYRLDPIPRAADIAAIRVQSSIGNPIFLAAYLIMVIPLTIKRLIDSLSPLASGKEVASPLNLLSAACYVYILVAQLTCIVFTQSRGPFIGLIGGLFFFLLLLAISKDKRGLALTVIALAVQLLLFFVILNLPNTPLASIRDIPYLGRMVTMSPDLARGGKGRLLIWEGAVNMAAADPVRTIIGYGPETMYIAFHPYAPPELADVEGLGRPADRCHNETLDVLVTRGLLGLAAYLLLFGSLFYYCFKWLGLVESRRQRALFAALLLVGGSLGVLIPWFVEGALRFAGVGIPMGIIAALAVYLVMFLFQRRKGKVRDNYRQILLITLLSAVIAHFIEIQFGIGIAATRTYFWLYTALMIIAAPLLRKEPGLLQAPAEVSVAKPLSKRRRGRRRRRKARRLASGKGGMASPWNVPFLSRSLLVSLILMTMGFAFINNQYPLSANGFSVPLLFFLTWLSCGLIIVGEMNQGNIARQKKASWTSCLLPYFLFSLGPFFLFLIFHTTNLPPDGDPATTIVIYYLFFLTTIIATAATLLKGLILPSTRWQHAHWWLYAILMAGIALLILTTNLNVVRADIRLHQGLAYADAQRWDESIAFHRQALELAPHEDRYYFFLGQAYVGKARLDAERRSVWFEEARKALEQARRISPLDPNHVSNLGHLYRDWALATTSPAERIERLNRSLDYYRQTTALSPHNLGRLIREKVIEDHVLLGDSYVAMGEFDQAVGAYTQAIEIDPQKALQVGLKAVEDFPNQFANHRTLAMLYQQLGRTGEALTEAEKAKDLAPERERAELDKLMAWLEAQGE